jgi:hypothetical protein
MIESLRLVFLGGIKAYGGRLVELEVTASVQAGITYNRPSRKGPAARVKSNNGLTACR